MCERYTFTQKSTEYSETALNAEFPGFQPRYNIAPESRDPRNVGRLYSGRYAVGACAYGRL